MTDQSPFLRPNEVEKISLLSDVTRWRHEKTGNFPRRIRITDRKIVYRKSDIDDLNVRIFYQLARCLMNGRDLPAVRYLSRLFRPPRSDRNNRETGHCVSRQLNVGHDKACTDTTDLKLSASDLRVRFKI